MKQRTFNLAWPFLAFVAVLIIEETVWGFGAQLFENPATQTNYASKIANGTPVPGYVPVAGPCTSTNTATGIGTTDRQCWKAPADGLPTGAPGQVLGVGTVTTTGTSAGTAWQGVNGSIVAGSNITISKGTATATNSAANLAESPKIHAVGLVQGSGSISGTTNYIVKKTASGWGDSALFESGTTLYANESVFFQQANGNPSYQINGYSDSSFAAPYMYFVRRRGTLSVPADVQAGDSLGFLGFNGRANTSTAEAARLSASASSLNGSNIVGSMCASVSDGTSITPNVNLWCGTSSELVVSVPLTLSGLTDKGTGKVLYDTNGAGVIGEKALAISDVTGLQTSLDAKPTLGTSPVVDVSINPPSSGAATQAAREDHVHRLGSNYPAPGWLPFAYSTATSTATGTGNTIAWRQAQESDVAGLTTDLAAKEPTLPVGNVGQVVCYTGTGTGTTTSKSACAQTTSASVSYYTGTMAEVGWQNGSPGTSTSVSRGDHIHACTAATTSSQGCMSYQDKQKLDGLAADAFTVKPYSDAAAGYLQDTIFSYTGSISVGINTSQQKLNLNTVFGTATPVSIGTSGSVGTAVDSSHSDHTHGAGAGSLMQRYEYVSGSTHAPSGSGSWEKVNQQTFTAVGTKFKVSAHARFMASGAAYTYGHLCGLSIMADAGSTASTLRGPKDWIKSEPNTVFYNTTMWPTDPTGGTYIGNASAEAEFTLSEGTVAVAAAVYQYGNHSSSCTVPTGEMVVYVDVYK